MVEQGIITVTYIPTRNMVVDTLTKELPKEQYWRFMRVLGLQTVKSEVMWTMQVSHHRCKQCGAEYTSRNKLYANWRKMKDEK